MPVTVLEKLSFGIPATILYLQNRLSPELFAAGIIDLLFGILFVIAYIRRGSKNYIE